MCFTSCVMLLFYTLREVYTKFGMVSRRTKVVGTFPDGNSALMLVCARLRHVACTQWGNKKYMNNSKISS